MDFSSISQDDLTDVTELAEKLENYIFEMLEGNERNISISVLMSASINCMLSQCDTLHEVVLYRDLFVQILDASIRTIHVKKKK